MKNVFGRIFIIKVDDAVNEIVFALSSCRSDDTFPDFSPGGAVPESMKAPLRFLEKSFARQTTCSDGEDSLDLSAKLEGLQLL